MTRDERAVWKDKLWEGCYVDQISCQVGVAAQWDSAAAGAYAAGPNELVDTGPNPAGFWLGLWQGLISPITFIVSLFTPTVNIYEVQNNGNWYDFGFILGVACASGSGGWGGAAGTRRTRRRSSQETDLTRRKHAPQRDQRTSSCRRCNCWSAQALVTELQDLLCGGRMSRRSAPAHADAGEGELIADRVQGTPSSARSGAESCGAVPRVREGDQRHRPHRRGTAATPNCALDHEA